MDFYDATLTEILDDRARLTPDAPFLQDRDGEPFSYVDVHLTARRISAGLSALGVQAADTVLLLLPNGPELVHSWLGINALGAIEVPVNVHLRGDFLSHVINDSRAAVLIVHADLVGALTGLGALTHLRIAVVVGEGDIAFLPTGIATVPFEQLLSSGVAPGVRRADFSDLSAIHYTSGTTGPAKGIMFTYGQGCLTSRNALRAMHATDQDVFFCCMPLFHSNAQVLQVGGAMMAGGRVSVWPEFSASGWLSQIRSVGATITNTLGVMMEYLYRQPERPDDADNPLRVLQAIPAPAGLVDKFEKRFALTCVDGYGLTDVGMVAFRRIDEPLVPGGSGRPVDDYEVIVADPETDRELPVGRVGEILIRPKVPFGFMRGYWNRPEATVAAWRNLWFHTGDTGEFDADGQLYFRDRVNDSIRVRGENISSSQIESVVAAHPDVAQCAAVSVPSELGDYEVLLFVVPVPGVSPDPAELFAFCQGRMPYFAVPRYWDVIPELPMTATSKVRKVELRQQGIGPRTWDRVAAGHLVSKT